MPRISVLGVFNADMKVTVDHFPLAGETIHGRHFAVQPGGKGFNQAVAARRGGAEVSMLTRLGQDGFADLARTVMAEERMDAGHIGTSAEHPTGTAMILLEESSAENAIVITPGAASFLTETDIDALAAAITSADLFLTNLEIPLAAARRGMQIARRHGVPTLLDPAPAQALPDDIYALSDYLTPNETETGRLTGMEIRTVADAGQAGRLLVEKGVGTAIITLGAQGVVAVNAAGTRHVPAMNAGPVTDTTGAGDAFNGCLAAAITRGDDLDYALRYASAGAALAVTRHGAAAAMARHDEIAGLLKTAVSA
jgi:ribokinase